MQQELANTLDEAQRLRLMAEIEDEVLRNHWIIPLYDASTVFGYTDRVAGPSPCRNLACTSWICNASSSKSNGPAGTEFPLAKLAIAVRSTCGAQHEGV